MKPIRALVAAALMLVCGPVLAQNLVIGTKLELNTLDPQAVIPVFFPTWEFAAKTNVAVEVRADRRANA